MTALVTDNLPLVAGAPNGIAKLRELIQELAIRGKLVSQDAGDESASELLAQIAAEKNSLSKPTKPLGSVSAAEQRHAVPHGWAWARLGSLVLESGAGWSPSCEPRPREGDEWGVLKVSAVSWKAYRPEENKALPANLEPRPEHKVQPGDFLVSRANTAELVARSVVVDSTPPRLMLSDKIVRLKLSQSCNRRFVNLANSCPDARRYYGAVAGGTSGSMKNVSREQILNLPVPVPPLAEQYRIVAKVDELMALCDRLEAEQTDAEAAHAQLVQALLTSLTQARDAADFRASWQQLAEHFHTLFTTEASIEALKLAVCQMGVSGRLVQPEASSGVIPALVEQLADHWRKRSPRRLSLAIVPEAGQRYPLPSTWAWLHFGFVAETRLGKMLDAAKNTGGLKPYLRNTNVQWDRFELDDLKELRLEASELDEYAVKVGDLMICEGGEPGRCAVWRDSSREIYFQKALHRARPLSGISEDYLQICLQVDAATAVLSQLFTGATIKHLTGEKLERYSVPVPPPEEQRRIVAKVTELLALCDQLKADLSQARQHHENLACVLVEQAVA